MKTFYLQLGTDGHLFIDDHMHDECEKLAETTAETWKQARQQLTTI